MKGCNHLNGRGISTTSFIIFLLLLFIFGGVAHFVKLDKISSKAVEEASRLKEENKSLKLEISNISENLNKLKKGGEDLEKKSLYLDSINKILSTKEAEYKEVLKDLSIALVKEGYSKRIVYNFRVLYYDSLTVKNSSYQIKYDKLNKTITPTLSWNKKNTFVDYDVGMMIGDIPPVLLLTKKGQEGEIPHGSIKRSVLLEYVSKPVVDTVR